MFKSKVVKKWILLQNGVLFFLFYTEVSIQSIIVITLLPLIKQQNFSNIEWGTFPPYLPSFLLFWKWILLIWSINESEGFPVNWSQARGSSGTIDKTLSSWVLNSSTVHLIRFLIWIRSELNNLGLAQCVPISPAMHHCI